MVHLDEERDVEIEEEEMHDDEVDANPDDVVRATCVNRLRQRLVHSIDTALDLNNYNPFELPDEHKTKKGIVKDRHKNNDIHYKFANQPTNAHVGRNNRANVIRGREGFAPFAKDTRTNKEAFEHFITRDIIHKVVNYTTLKIEKLVAELPDDFDNNKYPFIKPTIPSEISAFVGLFLYRGLYKLNTISINKLFSTNYGPPIFSATMSRNRFTFLLANLAFHDQTTRDNRWRKDRFAAIREFFEDFNDQCMTCLVPCDYLSLDETLYPMRIQIGFKQYNPNKPAKYGLLFKSINAARYPYNFVAAPYSGKPVEEGGAYYIQGTEGIVKYLIERKQSKSPLAGRNLSFDRLYTSITLSLWLYERNITSIGTMQINRKGIPPEIKDVKDREPLSSEIYWQQGGPLCLSSYAVKTATKKNVLLLSTLAPMLASTKDDNRNKLALYKLYDFTKGGTDIVDQRMGFHTCKPKSRNGL